MEQHNFLRDPKIYLSLLIVLVVTVLLFPEEGKFKYNYQKGRPWVYETLLSPIDFPILKTDQELLREKEEKASEVIPYFDYDNTVANLQIRRLRTLHGKNGIDDHVLYYIMESLYNIYTVGILPPMDNMSTVGTCGHNSGADGQTGTGKTYSRGIYSEEGRRLHEVLSFSQLPVLRR